MVRSYYRVLHNWSNAHYQFLNGTLPESEWPPHLREVETRPARTLMWEMWDDTQILYSDNFRVLINGLRP